MTAITVALLLWVAWVFHMLTREWANFKTEVCELCSHTGDQHVFGFAHFMDWDFICRSCGSICDVR